MSKAISIDFTIDNTLALNSINSIGSSLQKLGGTANINLGSMISKVTAGTLAFNQISLAISSIAGAFSKPLQVFNEFEKGIKNIESLGVKNIGQLKTAVLELGANEVPLSFNNLTDGLYQVVSAGVDAENQIRVLEMTAKAGVAGLATTTDALELSSAIVKGYGLSWDDTEEILDKAFTTVKLGQTTFSELSKSIGKVAPLMSSLGISTDELFASFSSLTGVTGNTAEVSTQLKAIMTGLSKPTENFSELIKQQGYESVESALKSEGLAGVLRFLQEATGGSTTEMNKYFTSVESVTGLLALTTTQNQNFLNQTKEMKTSIGSMNDAFVINAGTIENSATLFENKLNRRLIEFVDFMRPAVIGIIDFGTALMDIDFNPIIIGAGMVAGALIGMGIANTIAGLGGLAGAIKFVGFAFAYYSKIITISIVSIPLIGWVIAAVSALITLGGILWATAKSEKDLAEERKKTAETSLQIVDAEKKKTQALIEDGVEVEKNRKKLSLLNEEMLRQQKILLDSKIIIAKEEMIEATNEIYKSQFALTDYQGTMNALVGKYGTNYGKMKDITERTLEAIGNKLIYNSKLTEDEKEDLEDKRDLWGEILTTVNNAYQKSEDYNNLITARKDADTPQVSVADKADKGDDGSGGNGGTAKQEFSESSILNLQLENNIINYEDYYAKKSALLGESIEEAKRKYGEDSGQYLTLLSEKTELDVAYQNSFRTGYDTSLQYLESLKEAGLVSDFDYNAEKKRILDEAIIYEEEQNNINSERYNNLLAEKMQAELDYNQQLREMDLEKLEFYYSEKLLSDETYYTMKKQYMQDEIDAIVKNYGIDSAEAKKLLLAKEKLNVEEVNNKKKTEEKKKQLALDFAQFTASNLSDIAQMFAHQSHAAFLIAKRFSQVETLINTYDAAQRAYASQLIPGDVTSPTRAAVAAAIATAVGLARVAQIEAQSFAVGGVVTAPTLAIVGDAKQSGNETNTEFILNTPQMEELLKKSNNGNNTVVNIDYNLIKNAFLEALDNTSIKVMGEIDMESEKVYLLSQKGEVNYTRKLL